MSRVRATVAFGSTIRLKPSGFPLTPPIRDARAVALQISDPGTAEGGSLFLTAPRMSTMKAAGGRYEKTH